MSLLLRAHIRIKVFYFSNFTIILNLGIFHVSDLYMVPTDASWTNVSDDTSFPNFYGYKVYIYIYIWNVELKHYILENIREYIHSIKWIEMMIILLIYIVNSIDKIIIFTTFSNFFFIFSNSSRKGVTVMHIELVVQYSLVSRYDSHSTN